MSLDWILDSLTQAGVVDVVFVGGYQMARVQQVYPHLRFYENTEWPNNNVMESLMYTYAASETDTSFVASDSDIVYRRSVAQRLMATQAEVVLVVDAGWRKRYSGSAHHPESQAEKVLIKEERVVEIGKHLPSDKADGQFIGLAKFSRPAIFNADQGSQFTSEAFTGVLREAGIAIGMDGVGRAFDNIMVERLWRTVKYEDVYLRDYETPAEARLGLDRYFAYYNHLRRHRRLDRRTPARVYALETPGSSERILMTPTRSDRIETGGGRSVAARAVVAPVALRALSATAAGTLPMTTVPPYSRPGSVQRMGTS